jgi:hypothetical protein
MGEKEGKKMKEASFSPKTENSNFSRVYLWPIPAPMRLFFAEKSNSDSTDIHSSDFIRPFSHFYFQQDHQQDQQDQHENTQFNPKAWHQTYDLTLIPSWPSFPLPMMALLHVLLLRLAVVQRLSKKASNVDDR